jgi:hypothetical protein
MKFNDSRLIELAKSTYYSSEMAPQRLPQLKKVFEKTELDNKERNDLIDFVNEYRRKTPISMSTMKRELLNLVGYKGTNYSTGNIVNRDELAAVYEFVVTKLLAKN